MDVTAEYRIEGIFYCFTEPVICGGMVRKVHAHTEQQSDFFGGKTCLEQIYDYYHGHGYAVVFFVYRRCNYLCFDIVVYHAFGQRLAAQAVKKIAEGEHAAVLPICAEVEAEIAGMDYEEKQLFLSDMGLSESGLDRLISACYSLLGLISYLTAGQPEVRAWTITRGTKAPQAAGKIHTDFERGFIRAEVIAYDDLIACGSMAAAKEKGLVRSEGKEYVMQDGDVVIFRFNV